ncbi:deazaflavin-dependent oxidoreductase (nitroreductase family) [Crossiella equi]|uniref:Deazaflavin-dependent oxidoreductase (Nitroreductase family) n=1 Tax=Crossiella equi TaxID=130796 RepID=A0ABS5A4A4_9PSEU|nr:nitroreductase family deazaflavin-dependent oxidoreductase [Crossiella equi]MBP2471404.1 deazaflavin-dependent oxidoreductase (nitroreductase family) [Crossiella equi]
MGNEFNERVIEEFRANGGKVGGQFEGTDLVLLTTTGARSGQPRTAPVVYHRVGQELVVVASNGGAHQHPAWYHNLVANPAGTAEIGTEKFGFLAVPLTGADRDRAFAEVVAHSPGFGEFAESTDRVIPVVALRRAG